MTARATSGAGTGLPSTIVSKTTTYTAASGEYVKADATSAGFTVTLPSNPSAGALVAVKKTDSTSNTVTIAPSGSGSIDGQSTAATTTQYAGAIFEHLGSDVWHVMASMTTTGPKGDTGPTGPTGPQGDIGPSGPSGGSGLLTIVQYNPTSNTEVTTTSQTMVDVDATNLKVTFTAPATGRVLVRLNGIPRGASGGSPSAAWGLRDGSGLIAGTKGDMTLSQSDQRCTLACWVTGLTSGNSYTWTWGHCLNSGAGTVAFRCGGNDAVGNYGPATMEVWSA